MAGRMERNEHRLLAWPGSVLIVATVVLLLGTTFLPNRQAAAREVQPPEIAACAQNIYEGQTVKAVVHTRHDVVIGPVRFGDLDPRLVGKLPGSRLLSIKSPLTVGATPYLSVSVRATGTLGPVSVGYGQIPSTTSTTLKLAMQSESVTLAGPLACGLPATGFIQYGGGISLAKGQCVILAVSAPNGKLIASKKVPLGVAKCSSKARA